MRRHLVALLLVLAAERAHAGDPPGSDRPKAEMHFRIATKAYRAQNFAAAAEQFEDAYRALPIPEIAFSAAQSYRRLYRTDPKLAHAQRAVELYKIYLAAVKRGGRVRDAADSIGEMEDAIREQRAAGAVAPVATPRPPAAEERTRIVIDAELQSEAGSGVTAMTEIGEMREDAMPKVRAFLDGRPVTPYETIDVAPGTHRVRVEAPGYLPVETTATAREGFSIPVRVELKPQPARVTIATEAGARVRIDGRAVGQAPLAPLELAAGKHVISLSRDGREPVAREITVTRGQALALREPLEKTTRRKAVPWVLGGAGGVALVAVAAGVGAAIENGRAEDQHKLILAGDASPRVADQYDAHRRRRDQLTTGAWITGGAALVVAGIGIALYVGDTPSDDGVRVAPLATSGGGGVTLGGRF